MPNHPITQYVKEAHAQGASNEQIVKALTDAGWHVEQILEIMLQHTLEQTRSTPGTEVTATAAATARPSDAMISVQGISKHFKKIKAVDNVSLDIKRGGVTALLGPNGAGKTTLVRMLTTLMEPTSGSAKVAGFDVVKDAQKLRSIIGLTGQYAAVDEILTGRENLVMVGQLYHLSNSDAKKRAAELLGQFELDDAADRQTKTYSGGMRRRLDLAASLIMKPQVLFLDEPTSGLDPRSRFALWNIIRDLVSDGTTVMLTTQYLEEADQLANYIFVIDHGHIIAQGTSDELKRSVGGDVVELHTTNHADAERAAQAIKPFGSAEPRASTATGIVTMPSNTGAAVLLDVVRAVDAANIKLSDIVLRRPSLDDVFMKLTGHGAEEITT